MFETIFRSLTFLFIFSFTAVVLASSLFVQRIEYHEIILPVRPITGTIIILYFILQSGLAIANYIHMEHVTTSTIVDSSCPKVCFAVVGYREDAGYWRKCLESLKDTTYPNVVGIYAFVDGDEQEDQYMQTIFLDVFTKDTEEGDDDHDVSSPNERFTHCKLLPHSGKRGAMYRAFMDIRMLHPENEYVILIDSDTIVEPASTGNLVRAIHANEQNGCATGSLKIFNRVNLLTMIVDARYGYAFDIERSAMSFFGCMNCCSGPFSIYRQSILTDDLLNDFVTQTYCCQLVGPGDDRHLTNLVMMKGYRSVQTPFAIAHTESPVAFTRFLNQQLRWMRSFFREQWWQIRAIPLQHPYLSLITTYEILFPFFILLGFFQKFIVTDIPDTILIRRVIYGSAILLTRTLLLFWVEGFNPTYLLNILYFPLYFLFILPIKVYALLSCFKMGWITSSRHSILTNSSIETTIMTLVLSGWAALLAYYIHGFS